MPIPTINEQRAERAGIALIHYRAIATDLDAPSAAGRSGPKLDDAHTIASLMVDLCHLCRRHGVDPGPVLTFARARYRQHEREDGQAKPFATPTE